MHLPQYDLKETLLGGQAFNFDFDGEYFYGFTQKKTIKLRIDVGAGRDQPLLYWQTYPEKDDIEFVKSYLRLDINYQNVLKEIQKDRYVKSAVKKYPNLRLLRQDFEQTLLSFLISSNNNIASIRKIIRMMNRKFGKSVSVNKEKIFLFPETEVIADAKLEDLLKCKLGFRAKFLKTAAKHILETNLSKEIVKMSEDKARSRLKEIKGVGDKITDCVLVFSLGFDNVTPLDIWGKRICTRFYGLSPKTSYEVMRSWIMSYFGNYTAWAGQFLYEYIRHLKR